MSGMPTPGGAKVVSLGEVLMRLASPPSEMLPQDFLLEASFCGAEADVAVALAGFGDRARKAPAMPSLVGWCIA